MGLLLSSLFLIPLVAMGKWDDLGIAQEAFGCVFSFGSPFRFSFGSSSGIPASRSCVAAWV
jgi:hypothetical protein